VYSSRRRIMVSDMGGPAITAVTGEGKRYATPAT
jgi:hypothetical protein